MLSVDNLGNPAFISMQDVIYWKQSSGKWLKMWGCAKGIYFGGLNTFYKIDCEHRVQQYNRELGVWTGLLGGGDTKATSLAVDKAGKVYIISDSQLFRYTTTADWQKIEGLPRVKFVAARRKVYAVGGDGQVYEKTGDKFIATNLKA